MVDVGGNWNWFRLEQLLPEESLERIASIQLLSDSLEAVRLVLSNSPEVAVCGLVLSIKGWLSKVWQVRIQHVYREGNRVADRMATKGRMQRGLNATFIEVSTDVRDLVAGERSQSGLDRVDSTEEGAIPYDPGGGTIFR
ncbi:hypothetical protein V6N11_011779 [Hibiscus sabdariffa]|uniref:RNase H type-1 domain-containing protein n=1 Tax=Hibiscus sabdariffa TaxID=183260 RepID=A0ABR2S9B4_9ROSI